MSDEESPMPLRRKSHRIQGPDSDDDDAEEAVPVAALSASAAAATLPLNAAKDMCGAESKKSVAFNVEAAASDGVPAVSFVALPQSAADSVVVISEPDLLAIGQQIRQLEEEVQAIEESKRQEWKTVTGPAAKQRIDQLSDRIAALSSRVGKEKSQGEAHIEALEVEIAGALDMLDAEKRRYNFPESRTALGQGGMYLAFDDCRVEAICGRFELELAPSMGSDVGKISFLLSGVHADQAGASARMRLCDFKLKSDSLAVPSINVDDFSLEVTFRLTVVLSFDTATRKWSASGDDFSVDIIEFNGPFVLTRPVVSAIMSIAVPIMRDDLLKELPPELGLFVSSIPLPLNVNGSFRIDGDLPLDAMFCAMFSSQIVCQLTGCTPQVLLNFVAIQKSMERKDMISSVMDLMRYKRRYGSHEPQWSSIKALWDEAALIYFSQTVRTDPGAKAGRLFGGSGPSLQDLTAFLAFDKLLLGADRVRRNELNFHIDLKNIEGQIGLKNGMTNLHLFLMRSIEQIANSSAYLSEAQHRLLADATHMLSELTDKFNLVLKHVDHVHNKVSVEIRTGPGGRCDLLLKDFSAQAPIALWTGLPEDHVVTLDHFIVPTLVNVKTSREGLVKTKFFHMGCHEMMERANFLKFFSEYEAEGSKKSTLESSALNHSIEEAEKYGYLSMGSEVVSSSILRPHIAFILDRAMALQAGSELFTVNVGPVDGSWAPAGAAADADREYLADIRPLGEACPILLQTANQVKLLVKSPAITSHVRLESLVRYLEDHFKSVDRLLELLSHVSDDIESNMRYINFLSILVSFLGKYVRMPNMELKMDISVNMIANAGDVIVCIENHTQDSSALSAVAQVNIGDLAKDAAGLKTAFLNCLK